MTQPLRRKTFYPRHSAVLRVVIPSDTAFYVFNIPLTEPKAVVSKGLSEQAATDALTVERQEAGEGMT